MRKLLVLLVLVGVVFYGCSDLKINNVNTPEKADYSLVPIPAKAGLSDETIYSTTSTINGDLGGIITLNSSYLGDNGQTVTLNLTMTFPAGVFSGEKLITLIADDHYAAVSCYPSMVFNKSVHLDYSYTGLNIKNCYLPKDKNGFYFISDYGYLEPVVSSSFLIDKIAGNLSVTNAQINHFSRYGWTTRE
jgi:hypothetical protein